MSQRTLTITGTLTDITGAPLALAPCSVALLTPDGTPAIDGVGDVVQLDAVAFTTDSAGHYSQVVDYPGDFATTGCQLQVNENGTITDSPVGFAYASSIAVSTWYSAATTAGKVRLRLVYTTDGGVPIAGALATISLSQLAIDPNGGQVAASNAGSVKGITDSTGTFAFWVWPSSVLNPTTTFYTARISGEPGTIPFTAPATADLYRGAWAVGTTYTGATGTSAGDVVLDTGVLYRYIHATPSAGNLTSDATFWAVVSGLPTDLITDHLTTPAAAGTLALAAGNIVASPNVTAVSGDPVDPALSLDDQLVNLAWRDTQRLRYLGTWSSSTAYLANDVVNLSGTDYICILAHTNQTPPNGTYWASIGATSPDATTTTTGAVLLRTAPTGAHPVALTTSDLGIIGGVATLDTTGKVPPAQLPTSSASGGGGGGAVDATTADAQLWGRKARQVTSLVLGFIGDSLTSSFVQTGVGTYTPASPTCPASTATDLSVNGLTVTAVNQGVSGTKVSDWQAGGANLTNAFAAFDALGVTDVHVMLGTNDASAGVFLASYVSGLTALCEALLEHGYRRVFLTYSPYVIGQPGVDGNLVQYQGGIETIINNSTILPGDRTNYAVSQLNPSDYGADGVHFTQVGYNHQAARWAAALSAAIVAATGPQTTTSVTIGSNLTMTAVGSRYILSASPSMVNPMTTQDDVIIGDASGTPARLAKGTDGQVLTVDPGTHHVIWAAPTGALSVTTKGDLQGFSSTAARIPVGSDGLVLTADSTQALGVAWSSASGLGAVYAPLANGSTVSPGLVYNSAGAPILTRVV